MREGRRQREGWGEKEREREEKKDREYYQEGKEEGEENARARGVMVFPFKCFDFRCCPGQDGKERGGGGGVIWILLYNCSFSACISSEYVGALQSSADMTISQHRN